MTNVFYDTEFLEDGKSIHLISIGMVSETGDELYLINRDAPWHRIMQHEWLFQNVVPELAFSPFTTKHLRNYSSPQDSITFKVGAFLQSIPDVKLWAWYGAYDHVVLCQIFGDMTNLPKGIPYWTNDLRQEYYMRGLDPDIHKVPNRVGVHNAISDAMDLKARYEALIADFGER